MKTHFYRSWTSLILALLIVFTTLAATFSTVKAAGEDDDGIIESGEIIYDDIYLEADNVRVDGTVEGNIIATGYTITINGKITGDAFLFGNEVIIGEQAEIGGNVFTGAQTIEIAGDISGSLAAGGASLSLKSGSYIGRNLYYGGFSLDQEETSVIGVDLFAGNYQMILAGTVGRNITAGAAAVEINGIVNGDVTLEMGDIEGAPVYFPVPPGVAETLQAGLRVGESAKIGGDLKYTISQDQSSRIQAEPAGEIIFQTPVPYENTQIQKPIQRDFDNWGWAIGSFFTGILKKFWKNLFSLLVIGALVVSLLPGLFKRTVYQLRREPLSSAGFGILTVILGYVALFLAGAAVLAVSILLALFSLGGLQTATFGLGFTGLALASTLFTMMIIYGSKIVVGYLVGNWILRKISPDSKAASSPFWGMALGVLIYSILRVIPVFGGLIAFIVIILGVGAMFLAYRNRQVPMTEKLVEGSNISAAEQSSD